jgi:hypothetical protein
MTDETARRCLCAIWPHDMCPKHSTPTANERPECERTASCEPGDHTYSWPCVHAVTPTANESGDR